MISPAASIVVAIVASADAGWRPFIDPIKAYDSWWIFLVPLIVAISVVYKAVRLPSLEHYWRQVTRMSLQILAVFVVIAGALHILVQWIVPRM